MCTSKPYITGFFLPQSFLYKVFTIEFEGLLPQTAAGNIFFFFCVEGITGWPINAATKRVTRRDGASTFAD